MSLSKAIAIAGGVIGLIVVLVYFTSSHNGGQPQGLSSIAEWQRMVNPGALSKAHAFLSHDCSACHTPVKGVDPVNCIVCHANDEELLQRQPTAFHADISSCSECHMEHMGEHSRITSMNHGALTKIGLDKLDKSAGDDDEVAAVINILRNGLNKNTELKSRNPHLKKSEHGLNCAACHKNDDRHFDMFGNDCAACHQTSRWNIPEFIHPAATSMDCSQCHQAPPSHYMMHFNMISAKVAGRPHARVDQCFICHQTTSWNDIKRVGVYKHH